MTPRCLAALLLAGPIALTAPHAQAAPARAAPPASAAKPEENLPIPPIPPADAPTDLPAPVPNANLQAPTTPAQDGIAVRPTLNAGAPKLPGGDPIPGTLYRSEEEQRRQFIPNPGIQLVVPLQK